MVYLLDEPIKVAKKAQDNKHTLLWLKWLIQFLCLIYCKADVLTTVYDFKLKNFIAGYGKNVYISKYDYESFKDSDNDFADEEKEKLY